ncbi:MAG TPA: hypothetical protein VFK21_02870 [Gammaproteobacteria bacterium]|nr:hypothetical protein [Gammaproteobacteria bacterium]
MPIRPAHLLILVLLAAPGPVLADALREQVAQNLEQGTGLVHQKAQLEKQNRQLMAERQVLLQTGTALSREQTDLNQKLQDHNRAIDLQKQAISQNKGLCAGGSAPSGKGEVENCNQDIDALNSRSVSINAEAKALEARQTDLQARFGNYKQAAADWNKREAELVAKQNHLDGYLTNWLNFNYGFLAGGDFQAAIVSPGTLKACGSGTEPIKASSKQPVDESAKYVLGCLRAVNKQYAAAKPGG